MVHGTSIPFPVVIYTHDRASEKKKKKPHLFALPQRLHQLHSYETAELLTTTTNHCLLPGFVWNVYYHTKYTNITNVGDHRS